MRRKQASFRIAVVFSIAALLCSCATRTETTPAPPTLSDTPDLSAYHSLEISTNDHVRRDVAELRFVAQGAYLETATGHPGNPQRLYIQTEQCRDDAASACQRRYALTGTLDALGAPLKCYIQIRNDSNHGYQGQALQGLCQDNFSRSYSITISK